LNQVVAIQEKLGGKYDLLEDASRRFVREGPMIDLSGTEKRNRYYFLFNDLIVAASQGNKEFKDSWKRYSEISSSATTTFAVDQSGALKYKESFSVGGAQLRETSQNIQSLDPRWKNMFQIAEGGTWTNPEKVHTLITPSYESKVSWMGDIDDCIMQNLEIKKMRAITSNQVDYSEVKGLVSMTDTLLMQNTETGAWKERFVRLEMGTIQWFRSPTSLDSPKGSIDLYSCSVRLHRPSEKEFAFQIYASKQIYYFAASNGEKLFEWINAIRGGIEKIMEAKEKSSRVRQAKFTNLPPSIAQMLTEQENQCCGDCSVDQVNWSNVSQGVFLCDECYNLHKILSASTLKNLTRGKWTEDQIKILAKKGNKIVNAELACNVSNVEKITTQSPYETKVNYIKRKYNYEQYAPVAAQAIMESHSPAVSPRKGRMAGWLVLNEETSKQYYYVLKKSNIYYYKSKEKTNGTPRGVIDIQTASCRISPNDELTFEIITPSRIYSFISASSDERLEWFRQISAAKRDKPKSKFLRSLRFD